MEEILLVEKNGEVRRFKGAKAIRLATRFLFFLAALCLVAALVQVFLYVSQTRQIKRLKMEKAEMIREISALDRGLEKAGPQVPPPAESASPQTAVGDETGQNSLPAQEPDSSAKSDEQVPDSPVSMEDSDISMDEEEEATGEAEPAREAPAAEQAQTAPDEKEAAIVFASLADSEKGQTDRVSVRRFETVMEAGGKTFRIQFSIKNTSADGAALKGRGFVLLKNKEAAIDKLVLPAAQLKDGLPHPVSAGFSYSVANFGTISLKSLDKSYLNRFDAADLVLFDANGAFLFQQSFLREKQ